MGKKNRFCNGTQRVAGKKIKGRGVGKSKATQLYTPLDIIQTMYRVFEKNVAQQREQLETRGLFLCEDHGS